jgi:hypothetical protein
MSLGFGRLSELWAVRIARRVVKCASKFFSGTRRILRWGICRPEISTGLEVPHVRSNCVQPDRAAILVPRETKPLSAARLRAAASTQPYFGIPI